MQTVKITVFTPTYNRAHTLGALYESLKRQTFRNFEWLVVDDGSADDTEALFRRIGAEKNDFPVRYIRTPNGGKHRAINRGLQEAAGELFFIVDSDDFLPEESLQRIDRAEGEIPRDRQQEFAGLCGAKVYQDGSMIGSTFSGETLDITSLERSAWGITGDKAEVYFTELLRKYPFPSFEGETFMTECVVWDRIGADGYLLHFVQDPLMICEYREDGLSAHMGELYEKNPRGYGLFLRQRERLGILRGMEKWDSYLDFFYGLRDRYSFREISRMIDRNPIGLWTVFLGLRIYHKIVD